MFICSFFSVLFKGILFDNIVEKKLFSSSLCEVVEIQDIKDCIVNVNVCFTTQKYKDLYRHLFYNEHLLASSQ